jgi:hypothetical protein
MSHRVGNVRLVEDPPELSPELSPMQDRIRRELLGQGSPRPAFAPDLADELRAELEARLAPVVAALAGEDRLFVTKAKLKDALTCEGLAYGREQDTGFEWNERNVRGTLGHRAIQRLVMSRYAQTPIDAVDEIIVQTIEDDEPADLAAFLRGLRPGARAELLGEVADAVTKFTIDWPPVRREWSPRVESPQRAHLCDGRITLSGRPDLALGRPRGGLAGSFLCDLKSGYEHSGHLYDVRFYALVETLARRVPPFRVAVYYFDSSTYDVLDVDEALLESEARRVADGIARHAALRARRLDDLERTPNPLCPHCALFAGCEPGRAWAEARAELP